MIGPRQNPKAYPFATYTPHTHIIVWSTGLHVNLSPTWYTPCESDPHAHVEMDDGVTVASWFQLIFVYFQHYIRITLSNPRLKKGKQKRKKPLTHPTVCVVQYKSLQKRWKLATEFAVSACTRAMDMSLPPHVSRWKKKTSIQSINKSHKERKSIHMYFLLPLLFISALGVKNKSHHPSLPWYVDSNHSASNDALTHIHASKALCPFAHLLSLLAMTYFVKGRMALGEQKGPKKGFWLSFFC